MIKISDLSVYYDEVEVLKNISLEISQGENICILGPNGCGKTTLLRAIAGLIPSSGNIVIDGKNIRKMKRKEIATKLTLMSQNSSVYFPYQVYDAVMLGRFNKMKRTMLGSVPNKKDHECVEEWLNKTGLSDIKFKRLDELSGGQLQRVFLAQAIVQEPDIILLDEPTNHLDIKYQLELINHLKVWSKENNRMVIGVFHDINLALQLSENLIFLKEGQLAGKGKADQLMNTHFLQKIYGIDIHKYMIESLEKWTSFE